MSAPEMADTIAVALAFRERGWRPFPLDHPDAHGDGLDAHGKRTGCAGAHPTTKRPDKGIPCDGKRGKHPIGGWATMAASAPTDKMLELWFGGRAPRNIGIATKPSGLVVIDEDEDEALSHYADELGETLPITYRVRTSRGWHWYFLAPEGVVIRGAVAALKARHMDVRGNFGEGGYVVGAGSVHESGHVYEAEDSYVEPVEPPGWLIDVMLGRVAGDGADQQGHTGHTGPAVNVEGWSDGPRYGTAVDLHAQYQRHLNGVSSPGFRHSFFLAALDAWRLVNLGLLTLAQMRADLTEVTQRVWNADPDANDKLIVNQQAHAKAQASPWQLVGTGEGGIKLGTGELVTPREPADGEAVVGNLERLAELREEEHRRRVREALERKRANAEADRLYAAELRPPDPGPALTSLADLLAEPDEIESYRISQLWPTGGKVLLSAPQKSGKTTLVGNLVRALADGGAFLSRPARDGEWKVAAAGFQVTPLDEGRRVALFDFEMTRHKLKDWLRDQRIGNLGRVHVELMRGRLWDIRDPQIRAQWAAALRELNVAVIMVDPIGPILGSLGIEENDNTGVGGFLFALDALVRESGADELFVSHHTGHGTERARGASAFLGWPDAAWTIVRDEMGPQRAFKAEGRDVWLPETALVYDSVTRRLGLGDGDRTSARAAGDVATIVGIVTDSPAETLRGLQKLAKETELGAKEQRTRDAVAAAHATGAIHVHLGPNRARLHLAGACSDTCHQRDLPLAEP